MRRFDLGHNRVPVGVVRLPSSSSHEVGTGNELRRGSPAINFDPDRTAPGWYVGDKFVPSPHRVLFSVAGGIELIEIEEADADEGADVRVVIFALGRLPAITIGNVWFGQDRATSKNALKAV